MPRMGQQAALMSHIAMVMMLGVASSQFTGWIGKVKPVSGLVQALLIMGELDSITSSRLVGCAGKPVKACYGTTKYCNAFLKGTVCNNSDCLYLHGEGKLQMSSCLSQQASCQSCLSMARTAHGRGAVVTPAASLLLFPTRRQAHLACQAFVPLLLCY